MNEKLMTDKEADEYLLNFDESKEEAYSSSYWPDAPCYNCGKEGCYKGVICSECGLEGEEKRT